MNSKINILISGLMLAVLFITSGCGRESDAVVVDFTKTVAVDRPKSSEPESAQLKVAVGAMISPKETFAYYRQLLDYIGRKLGRGIQFIQRKTYGEINELLARDQIDLAFICSGPYVVGKEKPLNIKIFTKGQTLHIVNNLQIRKDDSSGTGMGLKNLRSRYFRLAGLQPKFECRDTEYVAIIPLFSSDQEPMMQTESLKDEATMEAPVKSFKCHSFRHGFFRNHCKKNSKN